MNITKIEEQIDKLRGFHTVCGKGSIKHAAFELNISQPALSKNIKSLEESVGVSLFQRHRRGIELTSSGSILLEYCNRLFLELADVSVRIEKQTELSGQLAVGSFETLSTAIWPHILKQLKNDLPDLTIEVSTENPSLMWKKLEEGSLHIVVDAEPVLSESYFSKLLYKDKFCLFVSSDFDSEAVLSTVSRASDSKGVSTSTHLANMGVNLPIRYAFDSFNSVQAVTLSGLCIGVLPMRLAKPYLKEKKLKPYMIDGETIEFGSHRICATTLESRRKEKRIKASMDSMKRCFS